MGAPLSFCLRVWNRAGRVARFVPLRRRCTPAAVRSLQSVVARGGLGPERLRALRLRQRPRLSAGPLLPLRASGRIIARAVGARSPCPRAVVQVRGGRGKPAAGGGATRSGRRAGGGGSGPAPGRGSRT